MLDLLTEGVEFTATPLPALGMMRLEWGGIVVSQLWRTDVNGTRPVRTLAGLLPAAAAVTDDYECALIGEVTYTAVSAVDGVSLEASATMTGGVSWLSIPVAPAHSIALDPATDLVTGLGSARAPMGTVHEVIGREDPLPVMGGLRRRAGALSLHCSTWAHAREVERLHTRRSVLLLRQPDHPGMDLWYVPGGDVSTSVDPETLTWAVEVSYREVSPQTGPLTGTLGRDYSDVLTEASTYLALRVAYATYADLQTGEA